jgi:hypothetical protein
MKIFLEHPDGRAYSRYMALRCSFATFTPISETFTPSSEFSERQSSPDYGDPHHG